MLKKKFGKIIKGDKKNNLDKFYKIISSLTQINTFRVTELYANCVEIMSLEDSRFVKNDTNILLILQKTITHQLE